MLGVVPGTLFLKLGSPWIIKALLGVFIIGLGIEMATRDRAKPHRPNALARTLISFASGFMAGLFGINLLFLAYMERIAENRQQFRTNVCFVFLIENIFRTITYLYNGMFPVFTLQITAISVPAAIIGLAIGGRIDRRIDEKRAKKAVIIGGQHSRESAAVPNIKRLTICELDMHLKNMLLPEGSFIHRRQVFFICKSDCRSKCPVL